MGVKHLLSPAQLFKEHLACSNSLRSLRTGWCFQITDTPSQSLLSSCKLLMATNLSCLLSGSGKSNWPEKLSYCMEGLTSLMVKKLHLILITGGHAIGSYVFHLLKISTRIRSLCLDIREVIKEGAACSPDCLCHEEQDWETEELFLNSLQELDICGFSGSNYDFTFVLRLLGWTRVLKSVTINFDPKATIDEDLCEQLLGLSGPEICMKIYIYRSGAKVMYTPVG